MAEEIREAVTADSGDTLATEVVELRLRNLDTLGPEKGHPNARFMKPATFRRLVENIRRDGCLTSLPLVATIEGEAPLYVASGNHRVQAAIEAGLESSPCIRIKAPISRERFVAIQLAHNAIEGEDDPNVLKQLYDELDLEFKEYSGLTDEAFDADEMTVTTLAGVSALYQDVTIAFIADDAEALKDFFARAEALDKKQQPIYTAERRDFDDFFDAVVRSKGARNAVNTAVAVRLLVDMANERLDQLEAEQTQEQTEAAGAD